jgi:proton glutamate symport protein
VTSANSPSFGGRHLTAWSLAALGAGLGLGLVLHGSQAPWVEQLASALETIGGVWISVLKFTVVPLVLTQALAAVMRTERLGTVGLKSLAVFLALLAAAATFTLLAAPSLIALYRVDPATIAALRAGVSVPDSVRDALGSGTEVGDWLWGFVPTSLSRLFRGANFLLVLLATIAAGLIAKRLAGPRRAQLQRGTTRLADLAMLVVGWVLRVMPLGVLALSFGLALSAGGSAVGLMTFFVVLVSGLMLVFTALLYPATAIIAGIRIRRFAQAVGPAQLVAVSTRSSLASLPALVEGGRARGLPVAATGFVLPLAVATFKLSMAISHPFMLLFLAHAFGVPLGLDRIMVFVGTILLISFATLGIPGGNPGVSTLPAFVAAGVPVEGVLILDAVETIPDIFKTITNVTADMSAAAIVTRGSAANAEA